MDGLIDGDESLGISSSSTGGPSASGMVDQATAMFRAVQPFGETGGSAQRRSFGQDTGGYAGDSSSMFSSKEGHGRGQMHRGSYHHQQQSGGRGGGGRRGSRGRGRGRGRGPQGPGVHRPLVSTFMVDKGVRQLVGQFASETLVQTLQQHKYLCMSHLDEETRHSLSIPETIQSYHSIYPLENFGASMQQPSCVASVPMLAMKAVHHGDGAAYMLRRLDGRHLVPTTEILERVKKAIDTWSIVANHPNVVGMREAFVSEEFMDTPSMYISSDYHPGACTLEQLYINPLKEGGHLEEKPELSEEMIWSYLVQMVCALKAIHSAGLYIGPVAMHPSKILVCSPDRIRFGFLGVSDVLVGQQGPIDVQAAQLLDLSALGSLILMLACAAKNERASLDQMIVSYSRDLCHVVAGLIASHKGGFQSWRNVAAALGPRLLDEIGSNQSSVDTIAMEMTKEVENGRIARFLMKLNTVVDRAELMGDTRWAETGDRYLLKLFRDFLFHQVDDQGQPLNDWGMAIDAINKTDAGLNEKVMLLSRDETSMLVVSYADIKRCLIASYDEIKRHGNPYHTHM